MTVRVSPVAVASISQPPSEKFAIRYVQAHRSGLEPGELVSRFDPTGLREAFRLMIMGILQGPSLPVGVSGDIATCSPFPVGATGLHPRPNPTRPRNAEGCMLLPCGCTCPQGFCYSARSSPPPVPLDSGVQGRQEGFSPGPQEQTETPVAIHPQVRPDSGPGSRRLWNRRYPGGVALRMPFPQGNRTLILLRIGKVSFTGEP